MLSNTTDSYGSVTKTLHWLIALLVLGMLIVGFVMASLPEGPTQHSLIAWHKSIGMTLLLLMVIRLGWRFANPPPALPATVPHWEHLAARSLQNLFYLLLFAMPISGWVMSSLGGHSVMVWGWFNAALPVAQNKQMADNVWTAHVVIAWVIIGCLALHIAAALKHHFIEKNNVLRRMLPGYRPPRIFNK